MNEMPVWLQMGFGFVFALFSGTYAYLTWRWWGLRREWRAFAHEYPEPDVMLLAQERRRYCRNQVLFCAFVSVVLWVYGAVMLTAAFERLP